MSKRLDYGKRFSYLLVVFGFLLIPFRVEAVMPPPYSKSAKSSVIKAIAVVKSVEEVDGDKSKILFSLEQSFGEKTLQKFEATCPTGSYFSPKPGMTGGTMYYRPHKGDRVLVTVDNEFHVTSYTKLDSTLENELKNNGLKNISFDLGRASIRRSVNQNTDQQKDNQMLKKGRTQWKEGELEKALLTLEEAVSLDRSNNQTVKVLKSMQLQKKKIDGLLKEASGFIDKSNYKEAKKSLKKASYISSKYETYQEIFQQLEEKELKRSISLMISATYFKEIAANDYATALLTFSKDKGMEQLHTIDKTLWDVELCQIGWQLFFNSSILVYNQILDKYPIVAYYNPFSDVFLITVWKKDKKEYKIVDSEILLGDFVRGNSKGIDQTPFWLREKKELVANLGVSVSLSILAFEEVFKTATAKNWRSKLKILTNSRALKEFNYPAISVSLGKQLISIINFSNPNTDNTQLRECHTRTANILHSIKKGTISSILSTAKETPSETREVLKKISPNWVDSLTTAAIINDRNNCLVLLTPKIFTIGTISFSFKKVNIQLELKRIDLLDYQQTYGEIKSYLENNYIGGE